MPVWTEQMLDGALIVIAALCALTVTGVAAILLHRLVTDAADAIIARRRRLHEPAVELAVIGELEPLSYVRSVPRRHYLVLEGLLLEYSARFTGEVREVLVPAFSAIGAVARNIGRTGSWFWWVRCDAARRLGLMGDPAAIGPLRAMLKDRRAEVRDHGRPGAAAVRRGRLGGRPDLLPACARRVQRAAHSRRDCAGGPDGGARPRGAGPDGDEPAGPGRGH